MNVPTRLAAFGAGLLVAAGAGAGLGALAGPIDVGGEEHPSPADAPAGEGSRTGAEADHTGSRGGGASTGSIGAEGTGSSGNGGGEASHDAAGHGGGPDGGVTVP